MRIYKTLPELKRERQMSVWHKALRSSWSPEDIDWKTPVGIPDDNRRDQLARVLSPVLMGEQAGLYSITSIIQILGQTANVEAQLFLTSMALDEAKHAELFTLYYGRLQRGALSIRRLPSGYLFQSAIMSDDPVEWLTGSLVSEVVAKHTLEELRALDFDPVLNEICDRILADEARHLGFNHIFLTDRFREARAEDATAADETAERLGQRLEQVLALVPPILEALGKDIEALGIRRGPFIERLYEETRTRLRHSLGARDLEIPELEGDSA